MLGQRRGQPGLEGSEAPLTRCDLKAQPGAGQHQLGDGARAEQHRVQQRGGLRGRWGGEHGPQRLAQVPQRAEVGGA